MNQSMPWSLLASTALALLLMTPMSTPGKSAAKTTLVGVVVASAQRSFAALSEASAANRPDVPEAGTLALLAAGTAGAWCVRRRTSRA